MSPTRAAADVDLLFSALADPTRRGVLRAVINTGPLTATRLSEGMTISRQAVAKHLSVLEAAGLVTSARRGRETLFEAQPQALRPAADWIAATDDAWARRLARLGQRVTSTRR